MDKKNIPIYRGIQKYLKTKPTAFHMPGHKLGKGLPDELVQQSVFLDLTEIPGADNLHHPTGMIREAQQLAAQCFGADSTFFLVNGSTSGIHAMILTMCRPGDKLIVGRDCHKSVINGMMLAGVIPVYLRPECEKEFGISSVILPAEVERALKENPDAAGVFITRPSYYGICSDIEKIAEITHFYGKPLAVDEAHGAHLIFNSKLPVCAMEGGADICVQSAHKTLPALTQGSYLHVKSGRIDTDRLSRTLGMLQTSSPSYILMTYLDAARDTMERNGKELLNSLLDNIHWLENEIAKVRNIRLLAEIDEKKGTLDRTRIVVCVKNLGISGFEADELLRREFNLQVEMSDLSNVVCIGTVSDTREDYVKLSEAISGLAGKFGSDRPLPSVDINLPKIAAQKMQLHEILGCTSRYMKLGRAKGMTSMNMITPYPPGIPIICPGEEITGDAIDYIRSIIESGGFVEGVSENLEVNVAV